VLSEDALDPAKAKLNFNCMKLVHHLTIPIKYLPFNAVNDLD
jgi:hypothetical protein